MGRDYSESILDFVYYMISGLSYSDLKEVRKEVDYIIRKQEDRSSRNSRRSVSPSRSRPNRDDKSSDRDSSSDRRTTRDNYSRSSSSQQNRRAKQYERSEGGHSQLSSIVVNTKNNKSEDVVTKNEDVSESRDE